MEAWLLVDGVSIPALTTEEQLHGGLHCDAAGFWINPGTMICGAVKPFSSQLRAQVYFVNFLFF